MSLASPHTFTPGELLTAANLQNIETNILNNPITLISPTTGAINFALQSHVSLIPGAITTTSASSGNALIYNGVSTGGVWGTPTVAASGVTIVAGSTGQVFAVTSSNSSPAFQVLPIDGGLSTTVPSAGMVYYISSSAGVLKGLTIGTSGQVLTVTTSGVVGWATPSASAGGTAGVRDPNIPQLFEDFQGSYSTAFVRLNSTVASTDLLTFFAQSGVWAMTGVAASAQSFDNSPLGIFNFQGNNNGNSAVATFPTFGNYFSTHKIQYDIRWRQFSTRQGQMLAGFTTGTMTTAPTNGVFLLSTLGSGTVSLFVVSTAGSTSLSAGVTASSFHTYRIIISSSSVDLSVDAVTVGSITAFNPSSGMFPLFGITGGDGAGPFYGMSIDYVSVQTSGRSTT